MPERGFRSVEAPKKTTRRGLIALLAAGALGLLSQMKGEAPEKGPDLEPERKVKPEHVQPRDTDPAPDSAANDVLGFESVERFKLSDLELTVEDFDVFDEDRLSWENWKNEAAKLETIQTFEQLLADTTIEQGDDGIHVYVKGREQPDLLITTEELAGGTGLILEEDGRQVMRTPEMNPDGAATRISASVGDMLMHEAMHLYSEKHGEQPIEGMLDEYDHDREPSTLTRGEDTGSN